ncbi:DMT family transporter [Carnobacterium funditum]|uniref:DMT family transporter n=1 Tax=Carnobacterium funditum TaxID=2752 RepID=UPI000552160E|nr:DMT family transporter [Carnobacterium funditum]
MKQNFGRLGLLLVTVIWGAGYVVSDVALNVLNPYQLMTGRFLLAFIAILILFSNKIKNITKKAATRGSILGVILYLAFLFQTVGLNYTTPSKNAFLTAVNVVLVPFIGLVLYKNKIALRAYLGAFLSIIGIGLLSLDGFNGFNLGDFLTLIGAVFFSFQIILTSRFVRTENIFSIMIVQMGVAALCGIVVMFFRGDPIPDFTLMGTLSVAYLGFFCTMFGFMLQTAAQRFTADTETAVILSMESLWGMLFSIILLHELVTVQTGIGAALILIGVLVSEIDIKKVILKNNQKNRRVKIAEKTLN